MGERKRNERAIRSVVRSLISRTGWVKAEQTWTYASATTFTVADHISGDRTVMFKVDAKLRLKQGGAYKYFTVVSASTSASVTTVTVTGWSDYTLANAAITDNFYSYAELPQGFPTWVKDRFAVSETGVVQIGDPGTDYTNFAADGEITLVGTARVMKSIPIANDSLGKGNTKPTEAIVGDYNAWLYDINDDSVFTFHIPHDWELGTDIVLNIDWVIQEAFATNSGEIQWRVHYSATPHDSTEAINSPTHSGALLTGDINIPATSLFFTQDSVTIPSADLAVGDQVGITLKRIAIVGGSNPTADPGVIDIHIEYTANKLGEAT